MGGSAGLSMGVVMRMASHYAQIDVAKTGDRCCQDRVGL